MRTRVRARSPAVNRYWVSVPVLDATSAPFALDDMTLVLLPEMGPAVSPSVDNAPKTTLREEADQGEDKD